jgi:two-component system sensor histidine kinase TctE
VATLAVAVLALMVSWWAVLAVRLVNRSVELEEQLQFLKTGQQVDLAGESSRLNFMVLTEFSVIVVALIVAVAVLLSFARQRRLGQIRMERLLQFTSHELKTPIAGVRALLQSLGGGAIPEDRRGEFIQRGLVEVDRLEHLAETILAWQRSVMATEAPKVSPLDGKKLVEDVLTHRKSTNVQEEVALDSLPEATVSVDADAFRVIFENLLDNARKYGGGKSHVSAQVEGGLWRVRVKDFGPGFPPSESARLFDPFRRSTHEGMTHGSGLGLFIAKQLALRMRGDLTASSSASGAEFCISLPLAGAPHA